MTHFTRTRIVAIVVYEDTGVEVPWHGATVYQGVDIAILRYMVKRATMAWLHQSDKRRGRQEVNRAWDMLDYTLMARRN